ncbi:MAG TPA: CPBP family intramembrane glutamic endopeptidase [Pseudomonadales bacterium]|nr:CPBP family intramembrane glutamic endopeptidase [Pseudomonadales bacterium]
MTDAPGIQDHRTPTAHPAAVLLDVLIVFAASGVAFLLEDLAIARGWMPFATEARGASAVVAGALAAVAVVLARGGSLADLGFRRPQRWAAVPLQVAAILVAFVAGSLLLPLLISLFVELPEPDLTRYASVAGNLGGAIGLALVLPLTASIPEEIIYRGFLIGRLSDLFGRHRRGAVMAVLVQALVFSAVHYQWGIGGVVMTLVMGIVWGTAYLLCGRNLWVVILAHSAGHILFVVQLYLAEPIAA